MPPNAKSISRARGESAISRGAYDGISRGKGCADHSNLHARDAKAGVGGQESVGSGQLRVEGSPREIVWNDSQFSYQRNEVRFLREFSAAGVISRGKGRGFQDGLCHGRAATATDTGETPVPPALSIGHCSMGIEH